jgi:hypothetical protein
VIDLTGLRRFVSGNWMIEHPVLLSARAESGAAATSC